MYRPFLICIYRPFPSTFRRQNVSFPELKRLDPALPPRVFVVVKQCDGFVDLLNQELALPSGLCDSESPPYRGRASNLESLL